MKPHPELVNEYPDKYCLAVSGGDYVIYLRWGGVCKLDLSDVSESSIIVSMVRPQKRRNSK